MEGLKIFIIKIIGESHNIYVSQPSEEFIGLNFFKGERNFISKFGFVISSANDVAQASTRTATFCFPEKQIPSRTTIGDSPRDRWYIEHLLIAIGEFNSKSDKKIEIEILYK